MISPQALNAKLEENLFQVAAAYPEDARDTPADERERHFTLTQKLAWLLRFGREGEFRQAVEDLQL